MAVARTMSMDSQVAVIGFSSNGTSNADAAVVVNWSDWDKKIALKVTGSESNVFNAFITTEGDGDDKGELFGNGKNYEDFGVYKLESETLVFESPKGSVITFFAK